MRQMKPSNHATAAHVAAKAGADTGANLPQKGVPFSNVPSSKAALTQRPPIGWFAYVRRHFRQTRGPLAFGLAAAILLAPLLSLVKPIVGHSGLAALAFGLAVLAVTLYVVYVVGMTKSYISSAVADRQLRGDETSGLAMLVWFCLWLAIGVGPVAVAEWHSSPDGWLAEFVPELRDEQVRWLGVQPPAAMAPVAVEAPISVPPPSPDAGNPFELEDEAVMPPNTVRSSPPTVSERLEAETRQDDKNPFETDP